MTLKQTLPALALALALAASASPITPEQALALLPASEASRIAASGQAPVLAETFRSDSGAATLYLFDTAGGGYVVTAADDAVSPILLGYGDRAEGEMPAQMRYWLSLYSSQIAGLAARGGSFQAPAGESLQAISPLCATTWNQTAPYNNDCPTVDGSTSVTGCVATALAQVMKKHKHPTKGTGSHSYSWTVNGTTYSTSFNYASYSPAWSSMLNSYPSATSGTSAQRSAVSQLMKAVGVSCDMNYSPTGSGAGAVSAGIGLITYLGYDRSMQIQKRDWYTNDEWKSLVYGELAAGRPLYMDGNDGTVGHAFVCDGCNASGYFHFNWGWGGYYDGYFLLTDLNPEGTGTGGGSGDEGYNNGVSILYNLKPDAGGSLATNWYCSGTLQSSGTSFNYSTDAIFISGGDDEMIYSLTLGTQTYKVGLRLEGPNGQSQYMVYTTAELPPYYGYPYIGFYASQFPVGRWRVYPAVAPTSTGVWADVHTDASSPKYLNCTVTSSSVTFQSADFEPELSATVDEVDPVDPADGTAIYLGHSYNVTTTVTTDWATSATIGLKLVNASSQTVATAPTQTVDIAGGGSTEAVFNITVPDNATPGNYTLVVTKGTTALSTPFAITVRSGDEPELDFTASLTGYTPTPDDEEANTIYYANSYQFTYSVTATTAYDGKMQVRLMSGSTPAATSADVNVSLQADTQQAVTFSLTTPEGTDAATYTLELLYTDTDGNMQSISSATQTFTLKPEPTEPEPDPAVEVVEWQLDGTSLLTGDTTLEFNPDQSTLTLELLGTAGTWEQSVGVSFTGVDVNFSQLYGLRPVSVAEGSKVTLVYNAPWQGLTEGASYTLQAVTEAGQSLTEARTVKVPLTDGLPLQVLLADPSGDVRLYTLQGCLVSPAMAAAAPGVYILVTPARSQLVKIQ